MAKLDSRCKNGHPVETNK